MSVQAASLKGRIPDAALSYIEQILTEHKVRLLITRPRKSKSGDYRAPYQQLGHRISVNGTLNQYAFLIVLLHELAHLEVWNKHRNKVLPHGTEWQQMFTKLSMPLMNSTVFPDDLLEELSLFFQRPPASSTGALHLARALKKYDKNAENVTLLEEIPMGSHFMLPDGRVFVKELKQRTRFKCFCLNNKRYYLVSPVAEVIQRAAMA
jgi:SprT protein